MQINTFSNVASMAQAQVSNKKADGNATENTKDTNVQSANSNQDILDKLNALGGKGISQIYLVQFQQQTMSTVLNTSNAQAGINDLLGGNDLNSVKSMLSDIDFASLGYNGKNPLTMNTDELNQLISEEGFFGIDNTANRIADFVIKGAGNDVEKLKKGLEGIKQGFEQAEKIWGGELPQISQDTIEATIKKVSDRIDELGGKTLDLKA
ncbi:hypothetical protein I8935_06500 [Campylobacter coli]|uniref:Hydrogenase-4 component G n=5 Tax=Campylobacter TaxID=194 RepID=A0A0Q2K7Z2_CAMCO|nr:MULTISPECIES: hypothetical protein [Campylobacter]EAI7420985.1 hypothetical protein [Campylobacter hyointestinalis]EAK5660807.1 hypothetical protein [Campylobacter fetus]EAL4001699.1 hypothetical protein [Campylobacter jejuni]EIA56229.1 hypothetical protein cco115_03499 [Campylobacter coli 2692]EIA58512.1 hypothetical protein cco117_01090 [Campylobacter coli 2698]EIA72804.1 hypothetical protein cco4_01427 [Campylobacter coli 7--1]EIA74252.1 hypothetical protein cco54_04523 [Campylobacter 